MIFKQISGKFYPYSTCFGLSVIHVTPRQPALRRPVEYIVSGDWPFASLSGPRLVSYAQLFARRLHHAVGDRSIREVARTANLSNSTLLAVMGGTRWPDMVTVAKLEEALDIDLWPGEEVRRGKP